ncbi:hypothetical protein GX50_02351 [[Emmonsia] crescens]|uniref:Uncharacterized protein n=1 Tax=[Emmonsia] crescens TaxID=73230 RepID=A0A2B7ZP54_9EURO|nr:hypothetical protein GX50_02351 [Emmonsia crescens]
MSPAETGQLRSKAPAMAPPPQFTAGQRMQELRLVMFLDVPYNLTTANQQLRIMAQPYSAALIRHHPCKHRQSGLKLRDLHAL